jgi:hypothetical protein
MYCSHEKCPYNPNKLCCATTNETCPLFTPLKISMYEVEEMLRIDQMETTQLNKYPVPDYDNKK